MKEDSTEQKLFKIANELLQTERSYVARLHLLDQVSVAPSSGTLQTELVGGAEVLSIKVLNRHETGQDQRFVQG